MKALTMPSRLPAIPLFSLLAAIMLFSATGCVKYSIPIPHPPANTPPPDTTSGSTPGAGGTFSVTLADTAWTANYYTAYLYHGRQMFKITGVANGKNGDSTYVVFTFYTPIQLNQPMSTSQTSDLAYYSYWGDIDWDAGNSTGNAVSYINVSAYDPSKHTIAGSFYGTLNNSTPGGNYSPGLAVSNGMFNLTYTDQP